MQQRNSYRVKAVIVAILFFISGFVSSYLFHLNSNDPFLALFPGYLFVWSSHLMFLITKTKLRLINLLFYYLTVYIVYLLVFFITEYSSYVSFFVGIITGGLGAIAVFKLTDKFIKRISFNNLQVFILGAISFILNDLILFISPLAKFIGPVYVIHTDNGNLSSAFALIFLFWQVPVGIKLFLTIVYKPDSQTK